MSRIPFISDEMRVLLGKYGTYLAIGTTLAGISATIYMSTRKMLSKTPKINTQIDEIIITIDNLVGSGKNISAKQGRLLGKIVVNIIEDMKKIHNVINIHEMSLNETGGQNVSILADPIAKIIDELQIIKSSLVSTTIIDVTVLAAIQGKLIATKTAIKNVENLCGKLNVDAEKLLL
jgi:hypothetical protein